MVDLGEGPRGIRPLFILGKKEEITERRKDSKQNKTSPHLTQVLDKPLRMPCHHFHFKGIENKICHHLHVHFYFFTLYLLTWYILSKPFYSLFTWKWWWHQVIETLCNFLSLKFNPDLKMISSPYCAVSEPNVYKHYKRLTRWNANRCYSVRLAYHTLETFQTLFPTASLIFTAVRFSSSDISGSMKHKPSRRNWRLIWKFEFTSCK